MPKRKPMTKAINKLAQLTGNELTGDFQRDEEIRRAESQPAPQQAMSANAAPAPAALNPEAEYRRLVQSNGDGTPVLGDDVTACLLFAGMTATWAGNHWLLRFKDGRTVTKRVGGRVVSRDRSGVAANALLSEWQKEINALAQSAVFGDSTER
jgi:hypothetical protein